MNGDSIRVGLDVTPMLNGSTGIARYTAILREGLTARDDLAVRSYAIGRALHPVAHIHRLPVPLRVVHAAWRHHLPLSVRPLTAAVDLVHCPDLVPPPSRLPIVVTIHDVLALQHPELFPPRTVRLVRDTRAQLNRVHTVITTCAATADAIAEVTGFDRDRIAVVHVGHRSPMATVDPPPISVPYVLAVGVVERRKAFDVLIAAMSTLGTDAPHVVIAGPRGSDAQEVLRSIDAHGMRDRVHHLDHVDDSTLESLYRHSLALCHPSVAEGFGSPALEALGYGVPLVAADIPSVREMAAGAARLVPVRDVSATAEALAAVWEDPAETARLVAAGLVRAQDYTWSAMISDTVAVYREALGA